MRKVIWSRAGMHFIVQRIGDGPISIIRTTDYDSGGCRSIDIPADAIAALRLALDEDAEMRRPVSRRVLPSPAGRGGVRDRQPAKVVA